MTEHTCQTGVGTQLIEIIQTISTHAIQNYKALHKRRFVVAAIPLLNVDVASYALCDTERPQRLDEYGRPSVSGQPLWGRFGIDFKEKLAFGGGGLGRLSHLFEYDPLKHRWVILFSTIFAASLSFIPRRAAIPFIPAFADSPNRFPYRRIRD
jgi:hypothetical protein